jgi:type IV secretion system protein VirB8
MSDMHEQDLADYYAKAESWAADREQLHAVSQRRAWIIAGIAAAIALLEAIAILVMLPLKTVEPFTLLVDRQTGYVQSLKPLERQDITPDDALVRSFLAQYVIAREGFDIATLRDSYNKVALWSQGEARSRYLASMQASNATSPLAILPRRAVVEVQVRSISMLNADTALVRFATVRTDPGAQSQAPQLWASVVKYRFSGAAMRAEDRLINPLGFQVVHYRRDAEMLSDSAPIMPSGVSSPASTQIASPAAGPAFGAAR